MMGYPFARRARSHRMFYRNTGDLTLNSTTWADLPTIGTTWDVLLKAAIGDRIRAELNATFDNQAVWAYLDVVTIVAAAAVNSFASQGAPNASGSGIPSWRGPASVYAQTGSAILYEVAANDLSGGKVTVRLRYRTLTAANKVLNASSGIPMMFFAENIGPPATYS